MHKPNEFQKAIRVLEKQGVFDEGDKVVYKADGSVWFKRPYREARGYTAADFAKYMYSKLAMMHANPILVTFSTKLSKWPHVNYFIARFIGAAH